jgi:putative transposase
MIATKCYRFRLEPTREQEERFLVFAGCRRFAWNWALNRKNSHYKETGKALRYHDLAAELVKLKKEPATAFLAECHSQILQQTLMDLEGAFKGFFEKRARFPRFKSKKRTSPAFRIPQNVKVIDGKVLIPKVGLVRAILHRPMEGTTKSATIKRDPSGHWFVTFVAHIELPDVDLALGDRPVGIDVGLESFVTLDHGEKVKPPKFYRRAERKLRRLQRQMSRSQKGSRTRSKRRRRLARACERVRNQRNDFLHKLSTSLVARYDLLCIEDLNLKGLAKTKLAKSFSDAALGSFLRMLDYKTDWTFRRVVRVGRFYPSSKTCHCCGHHPTLTLSDRTWTCEGCGVIHDRDVNAAINILSEGLRIVADGASETLNADGGNVRRATARSSR